MTTAEFKKLQQDADDRDIRAADIFVAASCLVITAVWAWFLVDALL